MAKIKHLHKYERIELGSKGWIIYKCMLPGCTHYLPMAKLIVGKESLCWGLCDGTVIYTQDDYEKKLKHPMCESCREQRKEQRQALASLKEID